ncbi:AAA family ATPase [Planktothrix mougeotii]|uniref:AAA family ATPase n=1 Tax=Planktothrix mougeotii LEGE 06226 TaxID=1828728 RepID=A0ABR9U6A4_9CYAN|nr:AAA family ATPase [Planktothrix mougeotii]MBE9141701.1 AAA family ATPase [Planktothrix mougeotii LEGE 06226]
MLKSLKIENFRCFSTFELQQLGRINLLVGTNNSGKTSILEAIQLFYKRDSLEGLSEIMISRGEYLWSDEEQKTRELDLRHLFYGHQINLGSSFSISGEYDDFRENLSIVIEQDQQLQLFDYLKDFVLLIKWLGKEKGNLEFPLSSNLGLSTDLIRRFRRNPVKSTLKTQFITSSSLRTETMMELFDQVVLTPEEDLITDALKTLDPKIERIAALGSDKNSFRSNRGFVIRLSDSDQRIPIGSMGDGIWRILGLTLALVNAKNGVLLVDEIDTGLHFSAMSDMWKLVWNTAKRLNIQVFATTHNSDCWTSLADLANSEILDGDGIKIHRIEKNKPNSIVFNENQMVIAAERGIEVR